MKKYIFETIEGYRTANPNQIIKYREKAIGYGDNESEAKQQVLDRYFRNNVTITKLRRVR